MAAQIPHMISNTGADSELSATKATAIAETSRVAFDDLVRHYTKFQRIDLSTWRLLKDDRGVRLFQGPATKPHRVRSAYRFVTTIEGTLDEVKAHSTNLTPEDMRDTMEKYADGILDMKVVHRIQGPWDAEPDLQILVRWYVNECPAPLHNRDFCVAEMQNGWTLPTGQRAWGLVQQSVRLKSCPDLGNAVRYQRAEMHHFGLLYVEQPNGRLEVFLHLEFDFKGFTPPSLYPYLMTRRARSVAKINGYLQARRAAAYEQPAKVPFGDRRHCQYCTRKFSPLWWKVHCDGCGEVLSGDHTPRTIVD
ncbi:adherance factor [Achlya hypogyna]|uniref:Adherance factor n=1 Tax=Achlya hypogyna TaxID=1202772 RepID=A0A1V9ZEP4_ACHHY|nr:adherance factor [Achlya hypogyna]